MRNWFHIRSQHDGSPQLLVEGYIGFWPVVAEEFRWQLSEYDESDPIEVRIDSMGGDPIAAKSIYTMLKQWKGEVTVIIENNCLSAATVIACAGDRVIIHDVGVYMIHEPEIWPDDWMREDEAQSVVDQVRIVKEQMVDIYASFTGKNASDIVDMMKKTTWMSASEALEAGFVHEIKNIIPEMENKTDLKLAARAYQVPKRFLTNAGRETSPEDTQTQNKTRKTMNEWMKKLRNAFGLGDDSDEADVYLSGKELKASAEKLKAQNEELESQLETVTLERDELKKKLGEYAEQVTEQAEEELEATLQAMVDHFQIKASEKDELAGEYKDDLAGLKKLQARIPKGALKASGTRRVQKPKQARSAAAGLLNETVARDLGVQ